MLEALIRTKMSGKDKRMGDVICVKLSEHADWGSLELRVHQAVPWHDYDLEQRLRSLIEVNKDHNNNRSKLIPKKYIIMYFIPHIKDNSNNIL